MTDFVNQMTAYTNFTQQQSINSNLSALAGAFSSLVTLNSVNYIGHTVEAKADTADADQRLGDLRLLAVGRGEQRLDHHQGLRRATRSGPARAPAIPEPTRFTWDGKDSNGKQLSDGGQVHDCGHRDRRCRQLGLQLLDDQR